MTYHLRNYGPLYILLASLALYIPTTTLAYFLLATSLYLPMQLLTLAAPIALIYPLIMLVKYIKTITSKNVGDMWERVLGSSYIISIIGLGAYFT